MGQPTKKQLTIIHACKARLGWSDEQYRCTLQESYKVDSSKDLTMQQAWEFVRVLQWTLVELGISMPTKKKGNKTHEDLGRYAEDRGDMATSLQLRKIEHLWRTQPKIRDRSDAALQKFLKAISAVSHIRWLNRRQASTVIRRLEEDYK